MSGAIDQREIDALAINADDGVQVYVMTGGHKFCVPPRLTFTLPGNPPKQVSCVCAFTVVPQRAEYFIPADRGCI